MFLPTNITLKFGDSGDYVAELQRRLSMIRYFPADAINGFYDGLTVNGVSQFQSVSGITADGVAGPETLRRLNGAISGDYSSASSSNAEEEARKQQEAAYQQQQLMQQQLLEQQRLEQQRLAEQQVYQQQQMQQQPAYAPPEPAAYATPPQQQSSAPAQPAPVQPATPNASELLNQMLASAPPEMAIPRAHVPQQPPAQPAQTHQQAPIPRPQTPAPEPYSPPAPQTAAQPQSNELPAQTQPKGMVGRAMQYANEMVQKLANYFESKLPNHVIAEVKQIGHAMAHSGVKEVPIPQGPEQQRERGVEQQRGVQQGRQVG